MAQQPSPVQEDADLSKNLAAAIRAIRYVDRRMKYGASNDSYDYCNKSIKSTYKSVALKTVLPIVCFPITSLPFSVIELLKGRAEISKVVRYPKKTSTIRVKKMRGAANNAVMKGILGGKVRRVQDEIEIKANMAIKHGCGNCGEHAQIAFCYLLNKKIHPLDYMELVDNDHAFVVIGRLKGSSPSDPGTWGSDAVVCDPWASQHGQAYPASQIQPKMKAFIDGAVIPRSRTRHE